MQIDNSKTYIGIVEDNDDPKRLGRCRIRVIDIFDEIEVEDIPWASPWKDMNGNESNVPEKGKILTVVFDSGNIYKPEYIFAEHYNINLEKKLEKISKEDYISMKSLIFDHKTQIYVNDSEGLKIDHKYNNLNIKDESINLNLKDNFKLLNLGDETAGQQAILGNHWMDWFDQFADHLLGTFGGPFLGNMGAPVVPNPGFITILQQYKALRDPVFLSHHVKIVDNNQVSTVKSEDRENAKQVGDKWKSTVHENPIEFVDDDYEPSEGIIDEDKEDDPSYVPPESDGTPDDALPDEDNTIEEEDKSDPKSNKIVDKLIRFMKSKKSKSGKQYVVYEEPYKLNIVGMRNPKKDDGTVTNKFDDDVHVFYLNGDNEWIHKKYQCTVVPGFEKGTKKIANRRAILQLGQYIDTYAIGYHKSRKDHKCLKYATSTVHRNNTPDRYNFTAPTETGGFGINIHRSGKVQGHNVYNWSHGCQVFKVNSQFKQFMKLCEKQVDEGGKKKFTYTLCKQSEFDEFA